MLINNPTRSLREMYDIAPDYLWGEEEEMSYSSQFEREQEALERDLERGYISNRDYNEAIRDLERDYRDAAYESARDAYEQELERW